MVVGGVFVNVNLLDVGDEHGVGVVLALAEVELVNLAATLVVMEDKLLDADLVGLPVGFVAVEDELLAVEAGGLEGACADRGFVGVLDGIVHFFPDVLGHDKDVGDLLEHVAGRSLELKGDLVAGAGDAIYSLPDAACIEGFVLLEEVIGEDDIVRREGLAVVPLDAIANGVDEGLRVGPLVFGGEPGDAIAGIGVEDVEGLEGIGGRKSVW